MKKVKLIYSIIYVKENLEIVLENIKLYKNIKNFL